MTWADWRRDKVDELSRSFAVVGIFVVLVYLLSETYSGDDWVGIPAHALVYAAVIIALRGAGASPRLIRLHAAVMAPAYVLHVIGVLLDNGVALAPGNVLTTVLSITTPVMVLRFVLTARRVNSNVIFAAISVYLLVGIVFGAAFTWLAYLDAEAFAPPQQVAAGDSALYYYSFVSLTTLGLGDIAPVSDTARALTVVEALIGQIYLVVLVARLVAMHIARRQAEAAAAQSAALREELRALVSGPAG